jgi:hypothetical protein
MEKKKDLNKINRRNFLLWLIPLASSYGIIRLFTSLYPSSIDWALFKGRKIGNKSVNTSSNQKSKTRKRNRGNWHNPNLVLNTKTNVVHYPSEKLFTYYNKIANNHVAIIKFGDWKQKVVPPKHFIKSKSGVILEKLALNNLSTPITNGKLQIATETLAIAFSQNYFNKDKYQMNTHNWRLYHLLLQLIALDTTIPLENKWSKFSEIIKNVDFKFVKIHPKNNWVKSKTEFDKRIKYIEANSARYIERIQKRVENT